MQDSSIKWLNLSILLLMTVTSIYEKLLDSVVYYFVVSEFYFFLLCNILLFWLYLGQDNALFCDGIRA